MKIEKIKKELESKALITQTDTVCGILSIDENLLYEIKKRDSSKKVIKFISNKNLLGKLDDKQKDFLNQFWPGQVTIIKDKISYRMPNSKFLLKLLKEFDYLYCSSANISNEKPIENLSEANVVFKDSKEKIFIHNNLFQKTSKKPSTIIDIDEWKILREGNDLKGIKIFLEGYENE